MDPQELIRIIQALDQLVETATKETVNNRDFDGQNLLDFIGEDISDYWDTLPREDGLLVYGPYDLEELVGAGRSDLNLVIEALTGEANDDIITGFRLQIMDQNTQSVGGPNRFRPDIDEIFDIDLGEFSTKKEMESLFNKTIDTGGGTASVSTVGDALDSIFPNSMASIEMALTNKGPVISDRLRRDIDRDFIPPYAKEAFEKVDAEEAAQYGELTGDVEVPDTVEAAAADVVPDNVSQLETDINDEDKVMQLLDDLKEKYGQFLDDTASEAGDGSGLHFDLTNGQIINGDEIYIEAFYLKPEAQGKGIGRKMVTALQKLSDEIGVPITLLDKTLESAYSASFWKSMGFDIDDDTSAGFYNYEGDPSSSRFARESLQLAPDNLADDVAEVNNDFVYNKFKDKVQTADNVILKEAGDGTVELLVIKRKRGPHRDLFALPGGILDVSLTKEQMIQGVVDPGAPNFRATEVHDFLMPFQSNVVLDITDNYRANEVFGAEALREALEEVDLKRKFIKNSFYLPIKYDRFDWDARAAGGVDVGGVGIIIKDVTESNLVDGQPVTSVVEEWIPKAKDDAIAYEWIKLDDVISGEKQLAFGHVEFVRDALNTSIKSNLFNKSNNVKMLKNISKYTYEDIAELDQRIFETSQRNSQIIKKANVVRKQNNQPLIPTENIDSVVKRKNKAFIDSIRGLRSYTSNSNNPVKFTAQMQMEPDFIFSELFGELTDQSLYALSVDDSDFVGFKDLVEVLDDDNNLYRETGEYLAADSLELTPSGRRKVKTEIKDYLSKNYKMKLKSKINQGMLIGDYIAAMANNADQIIKSKDFNLILDNLLEGGLKIEITPDGDAISVLNWGNSDLAEYVKLDDRNTIISEMGLSTAVDDNIGYVKNNYGDDVGNALENIRNKNNKFFARTFPPEIYIPSWDYYKDNHVSMPEAMLETQKLKLTEDNRLSGMVYHGGSGLNTKGIALKEILEKNLIPLSTSPSAVGQFENSMKGLINKITTETDLNFLDPRVYRGNMLNLNYMYTTSNPFLATSYSMGGFNINNVTTQNYNAIAAFHAILNHTDVLKPEDVNTLNSIKEDLKKLNLTIHDQNGSLNIVEADTGLLPQLADPAVLQIKFDVPSNSILHNDMPITRQLKNPNVSKFLQNVLSNLQSENIFDETIIDDLINNLMEVMRRDEINAVGYIDETMQSNVILQLQAALNDPEGTGAVTRKTIKDYYIRSLEDKQEIFKDKINTIVKDDAGSLRTLNEFLPQYLYAKEAISQQGLDDALKYVSSFNAGGNLVRPTYFVNQKNTAGHVLFTKNLNDTFADVKRINFDVALNFANNLPIEFLGGSYSATRDLLYLQKFMEVVRPDTEVFMDFIEYHKNNVGYKQIIKNMVQNKIEPTEDLLFDLANSARGYTSTNDVRVKSKYGIDLLKEVKSLTANINTEVDDIVFSLNNNVEGDKTLINFLNRINGLPQKYVEAVPKSGQFVDRLLLKSLAQSGIEIVAGTGGGRADALAYHDVFGIVDPGDKFGTGVPREATYQIKSVELDGDRTIFLNDVILGNRSFADLSDDEIKAIAEIIPLETIKNNETLSQTTKERWSKLYKDLNIYDERFVKSPENIAPRPLDGVFLQEFDGLRTMIAQQSIFGDVKDETVQRQVTKVMNLLEGQVDPQDVTKVMNATGLTRTLANGVDLFDAAVFGPVLIDLLMSRVSGVGSETATIGGAVADVAQDIYDPTETDTVFEQMYGSPETPGTLAGAVSDTFEIGKEAYVNPLLDGAKNNKIIMSMFDSLKDTAVSALNTVKDGFGLNDWIYNVKRDMYVSSKLKEKGYTGDRNVTKGLVKIIENEYESALPKTTDKYGQPLDVGDTTNFPSYNPGRR